MQRAEEEIEAFSCGFIFPWTINAQRRLLMHQARRSFEIPLPHLWHCWAELMRKDPALHASITEHNWGYNPRWGHKERVIGCFGAHLPATVRSCLSCIHCIFQAQSSPSTLKISQAVWFSLDFPCVAQPFFAQSDVVLWGCSKFSAAQVCHQMLCGCELFRDVMN